MAHVLKAGYAAAGCGSAARPNSIVNDWRPRYIVLSETCLSVYRDLNDMHKPLYSVIIIPESTAEAPCIDVEACAGPAGSSEFRVFVRDPPGNHCCLMFSSSHEQVSWIDAIRRAIRLSRFYLKAYITSVSRNGILAKRQRKYFVLGNKTITWHKDYDKVWEIESAFKFSFNTRTLYTDDTNTIYLANKSESTLELCFEEDKTEYLKWKDLIGKMVTASDEKLEDIKAAISECLQVGNMYHKFDYHGCQSEWKECSVFLTTTSLILLEAAADGSALSPLNASATFDPSKCIEILDFGPDSTCVETSESLCSFQVTNRKKLLRLRESSSHQMRTWIKAITRCISHSVPRKRDVFLNTAVRLIKEDIFYSVTLNVPGRLGFDLDGRDDGWVVVGHAGPDCGVSKGSVLTSIGGSSLLMQSSAAVLAKFVDWKAPLVLHFRKAPQKSGYLFEKTNRALGSKWRKRFFIMTCGQLQRHEDRHTIASQVFPLVGAAVFQINEADEGTSRVLTFRFVSGSESLLLQAESSDELLTWLSYLFHGIAIANGGSYVRRVEQARLTSLARIKTKGLHHKRVSSNGQLDLASIDENSQDEINSVEPDDIHEEQRWWWSMGCNSDEFAQLVTEDDSDENVIVGSSAILKATKHIMRDSNFYEPSNRKIAQGSTSIDKMPSSKKSVVSDNTRIFEEQLRIQSQLNRLLDGQEASRDAVRGALRQMLLNTGNSTDLSELEAAVAMADLWGVTGEEKDRADALLKQVSKTTASVTPPRPNSFKKLSSGSGGSTLILRPSFETLSVFGHAARTFALYPAQSPCNLTYTWSVALKTAVEAAINKGSYLFSESLLRGRVENWNGQHNRTYSKQAVDTALPCIESEDIRERTDHARVFMIDSCVQIFLNSIFIGVKIENENDVFVGADNTGLLISNYDEISVCGVDSHYSVLIRINLHASADVAVAGSGVLRCHPSEEKSTNEGSPIKSSAECAQKQDPKPVIRWVGDRTGELFSNLQGLLATYLGRYSRLQEMLEAADGKVEPITETFSDLATKLEEVDYSDLHLKTPPEGRIDFEIKCESKEARDALFLAIFYLVPAGKSTGGTDESVLPRFLTLRERAKCLPWNVSAEAVSQANALKERKLSQKQAAEYEAVIRQLQNDISNLQLKHAAEMKERDQEISTLRDRLNGQFGIL